MRASTTFGIVEERFCECRLGQRVIFRFAHALEEPVCVARPEAAVCEGKMAVELDRPFEILYRRVAVFDIERSKDEPPEIVAAAKIFFPRLGVVGSTFLQFFLLDIGQLKPQAFENALGDAVLEGKNIRALRIDAVAPKDVAGNHIKQLCRHPKFVLAAQETGRKHSVYPQIAARLARVDLFTVVLSDDGTRPDDYRAYLGELGYYRIRKGKFIKAGCRVVPEIFERQYRDTLFLLPCRRKI